MESFLSISTRLETYLANSSSEHQMQGTEQAVSPFSLFPGQQRFRQACLTQWGEGEKRQMSINLSNDDLSL